MRAGMTGALAAAGLLAAACFSPPTDTTPMTSEAVSTSVDAGGWVALTPMRIPRSEMPAAILDGRIYVVGGLTGSGDIPGVERTVEIYDPGLDRWEFGPELPDPRHHAMAAGLAGKLYVAGGFDAGWAPRSEAWVYHPTEEMWTELAPLPASIGAGAMAALGDSVYVVGGAPGGAMFLRYSPSLGSWEQLRGMEEPREHVGAAVLDGLLYVVGGRWPGENERASTEVYDPIGDGWRTVADMRTPRAGHAVAAFEGTIVALGGEVLGTRQVLTTVEAFDPETGRWATLPDLPHGLHGVPAVVVDGVLYLLGGSKSGAAIDNDGAVYRFAS